MIGTIDIKCVAARPNQPLSPLFTFTGSPSSVRIMDVPKSIGDWNITTVRLVVKYPDNSTIVKNSVRSGSVWVATIQGTEITGKVSSGYEIVADGIDEDGNEVTGYVLGCGDVFVLNRDSKVMKDIEKFYVKYSDELPTTPAKGDLIAHNGNVRLFDGETWLTLGTDPIVVDRLEEEIADVDAKVDDVYTKVDDVDAKVDDLDGKLYNKRDYFNIQYPTTPDRDSSKYGIYNPDLIVNGQITVLDDFLFNMDGSTWKSSDGVYRLNTKNGLDFTLAKNGVVIRTFSRTLDNLNINEMWVDAHNIPHQLISIMLFSHLALSSDVSKEIEVTEDRLMAAMPEKTSDIENDSGYITSEDVPEVPTKVSQLENDSEFVDKDFVNSSIATNTSNFKGTFNNESEFPTDATNNDYLFWKTVDEDGNTIYKRYKYIQSTSTWTYEYTLNNSSFTAEQWATINNGPYAKNEDIPTKTSELENDSNFISGTKSADGYYNIDVNKAYMAETDVMGNPIRTTYATKIETIQAIQDGSRYEVRGTISTSQDVEAKHFYMGVEPKLVATQEYVDNAIGQVLTQEEF